MTMLLVMVATAANCCFEKCFFDVVPVPEADVVIAVVCLMLQILMHRLQTKRHGHALGGQDRGIRYVSAVRVVLEVFVHLRCCHFCQL